MCPSLSCIIFKDYNKSSDVKSVITPEVAKKGGISKAVYGKNVKVTMYLSYSATTAVAKAGAAGAPGVTW